MKQQFFSKTLAAMAIVFAILCATPPLRATTITRGDAASTEVDSIADDNPQSQRSMKIIAHRGSYQGNAQNSREALRKAQELGLYGSETDVWLTKDGHIIINHDEDYNGTVIKNSTSDECRALILANGEYMPELRDFLKMIEASDSPTRLCIEIKDHGDKQLNDAATDAVVKMVSSFGLEDRVEYCSWSAEICDEIVRIDPSARVTYIRGNLTPSQLQERQFAGFTYDINVVREHPEWVKECKELGLTTHLWHINSLELMDEARQLDVDFITTDYPIDALTW